MAGGLWCRAAPICFAKDFSGDSQSSVRLSIGPCRVVRRGRTYRIGIVVRVGF